MPQHKLQNLRTELEALREPLEWSTIKAWVAKAKPIIRTFYREHLDDFAEVTREPEWSESPLCSSEDRYTGTVRSNEAEAEAFDARENAKLTSSCRREMLSFLDGLLQLESVSEGRVVNVSSEQKGWRVIVSHASTDEKLVSAFMRCLEDGVDLPDREIRCTSLHGHRLDPGDEISDTLRSNIEMCSVFIGLLTDSSLRSGFVLMELGAAWAFRKKACLVLAPSVDFKAIPGPFAGRLHAIRMDSQPDVVQLLEVVAKITGCPMRNGSKVTAAVLNLAEVARTMPSNSTQHSTAHHEDTKPESMHISDDDAVLILRNWIKTKLSNVSSDTFAYHDIDAQNKLAPDTTKRVMPRVMQQTSNWQFEGAGSHFTLSYVMPPRPVSTRPKSTL